MSDTKRLHALDAIRGITLLSMIAYHAMWDLVYMFGVSAPWYRSEGAYLWQQSICWTFILLSGFCHGLGRRPARRGCLILGASLLISGVTLVLMPEQRILWGVLTLLGLSMLLCVPLAKPLSHVPPAIGAVLSFALFLLFKSAQTGKLVLFGHTLYRMPEGLYQNDLTALLGFPGDGFSSTDYFPLLPWFFLYLCGWFLHSLCKKHGWLSVFASPRVPVLDFIGRHSLPIYLLHQPVIYGVLWVVFSV